MKIMFICGCLEPGKDGVGDYTRRLAGELMRQDISVGIIAYNDTFVGDEIKEQQASEGTVIPCLRIPAVWNGSTRSKHAKAWVQQHKPEWLSLQFVPYAFHKKGLPFGLGKQLKKIGGTTKWHIMFHELWLGLRQNDSLKYIAIGTIQKFLVNTLKNCINIQVVHTHTQLYLRELTKLNLKPQYLPIFSNIPFRKGVNHNTFLDSKKTSFVMFGSIHPNAPIKQFAQEVSAYFNSESLQEGSLVLVGKCGYEQQKWLKEFELHHIDAVVLGELAAEDISNVLQEASFGITTNPVFVVEKSGTVAAMREHGLPILIVSENTRPKDSLVLTLPNGFLEYRKGFFSELINQKLIINDIIGLSEIAGKFKTSLFGN